MTKRLIDKNSKNFDSRMLVLFIGITIFLIVIFGEGNGSVRAANTLDFKGVEYCTDCHPQEVIIWSNSQHSQTTINPMFRAQWKDLGSPKSCLKCHTTGYNDETKTYVFPEVSCEACHGPGDTMKIDTSVELCAGCHSGPYPTYEEWLNSGPAHGKATCLTCHDNHSSKLTYGTSTKTCGQCHDTHVKMLDNTVHAENGVECANCHITKQAADFVRGIPAKTGHSFKLSERELDCSSCHNRPLMKHDTLGEKAYACLSCHGDIHELKLELVNRSVYPLDNAVPLCAQCHNERYTAWKQGTHGDYNDPQAQCTQCHDPHKPIIDNIAILNSIPQRQEAEPPPVIPIIIVVIVIELLFFAVFIVRSRSNV